MMSDISLVTMSDSFAGDNERHTADDSGRHTADDERHIAGDNERYCRWEHLKHIA